MWWTSKEDAFISEKHSGAALCSENEHHAVFISVLILLHHNKICPSDEACWIKTSPNVYKYLMSSLSEWKNLKYFVAVCYPAPVNLPLFSVSVGTANNRRRCLWEDKCFLSSRSFLKAVVLGSVSRTCLIYWLKCHRDEQTIEAGGQSSVQMKNRDKKKKDPRMMTLNHQLLM